MYFSYTSLNKSKTYLAKDTTMSASSELISVKVSREACSHTSRARANTLRVPYVSSPEGRFVDDRL